MAKLTLVKYLKKTLKITGISIASVLLLMFLLPYLFPDTINREVTKWVNQHINGELKFSKAKLSFFHHFPSLTVTLYDFSLKGSAPYRNDTLIAAKELSMGVDLTTILGNNIRVNKFFLDHASINIQADENGAANYNVYTPAASTTKSTDTASASMRIEGIFINNSKLVYNDKSLPMLINVYGLNYAGRGDFAQQVFDLKTHADIDSLDLYYNGQAYLRHKRINADLLTKINTHSLDLVFDKNDLKINQLPVAFKGKLSFLKDGYDMDFVTKANETDLHSIFTALPPVIADKMEQLDMKGYAELAASLKGRYIASTGEMPTLHFDLRIKKGQITHEKAPAPITDMHLALKTRFVHMNMDSLFVDIDTLSFNVGKGNLQGFIHTQGIAKPYVNLQLATDIDLQQWAKSLNLTSFDVKGQYTMQLQAKGRYAVAEKRTGIRQVDTVISSIPAFSFKASLKDGYFQYDAASMPVNAINFNVEAVCADSNYRNTKLRLNNISVQAMENYIRGYARIKAAEDLPLEAELSTSFNLAHLKKIYPAKQFDLAGNLQLQVDTRGRYNPVKKLFPVTSAHLLLKQGSIKTIYSPEKLDNIQLDATLVNTAGTLQSSMLYIKPITFQLAGQPFTLQADFRNFDNLAYDVASKGDIDLGKLYQLFAVKGYNVTGLLHTDVHVKGTQADVLKQRYHKLYNKGSIAVQDLQVSTDLFPKPFFISEGLFTLVQDKLAFKQFKGSYGQSDFTMNGYLGNVLNYVLNNAKLTGNFQLHSHRLMVAELMAYAADTAAKQNTSTGVVLIPQNLDVQLGAHANKVDYNGLVLTDVKGGLHISNGMLALQQAGFVVAGAPVTMDATYASVDPLKANFTYHVTAKDFNIQRAYREIQLLRDMATSAKSIQGTVSLDYTLSGRLNEHMFPVYPSLKGGGTLSLVDVKVKGFKLLGAVARATERDSVAGAANLKKIDIKTTIANNIITLQRTKIKVFGFRPRFEGQVSFNGRLNLKGRLGLPPFGIFGIPLSITGTQENPRVRLRRAKDTDNLEETPDEEDVHEQQQYQQQQAAQQQ
jgi:AsmA protein